MRRMDGGGGEVRAEDKQQIIADERNDRSKNQSSSCVKIVKGWCLRAKAIGLENNTIMHILCPIEAIGHMAFSD